MPSRVTAARQRKSKNGDQGDDALIPNQAARLVHTRAIEHMDGIKRMATIDTEADLSAISASLLRPDKRYRTRNKTDGHFSSAGQQHLNLAGRVALPVRLGPADATAPFVVVLGVSFDVLLDVDFLYEHDITISVAQYALLIEAHGGLTLPLLGHNPRSKHTCTLEHGTILQKGTAALVRAVRRKTILQLLHNGTASPGSSLVERSKDDRLRP